MRFENDARPPGVGAVRDVLLLRVGLALALSIVLAGAPARAHGVDVAVAEESTVVLTARWDDGSPLALAAYRIHAVGEPEPAATGTTDEHGRIRFLPERAGEWRLVIHTPDGHGTETTFRSGNGGNADVMSPPAVGCPRLLVGVSLILGVFGLVSLLSRFRL